MKDLRRIIALFMVMKSFACLAQPTVSSTSPAKNSHTASPSTNIQVGFSQNMSPASTSTDAIRVYGSESGFRTGVYSGGGTSSLGFDPGADFHAGEQVRVVGTLSLQNTSNNGIVYPYVYSFRTKSTAGLGVYKNFALRAYPAQTLYATGIKTPGDYDNDGDMDLLEIVSNASGTLQFATWQNSGSTELTIASSCSLATNQVPNELRTTDCDNDGDLDAYFCLTNTSNIYLLRNTGAGTFTIGVAGTNTVGTNTTLDIADMDGDGFMDVIIANSSSQFRILLNNGSGGLTYYTSVALGSACLNMATGDFDGDGSIDCAGTSSNSPNFYVRLNDGSAILYGGSTVAVTSTATTIKAADLDNDGDLDLVAMLRNQNVLQLFSNNGSGSFTGSGTVSIGTSTNYCTQFAIADVDADGDLDLAASLYLASVNRRYLSLLRNDGGMTFTRFHYQHNYYLMAPGLDITMADFNNDGAVDICSGQAIFLNETTPPGINSFSPVYGMRGTEVLLNGTNLRSVTNVLFNNTPADSFRIFSESSLKAWVAPGTTTGKFKIAAFSTTVQSVPNFDIRGNVIGVSPSINTVAAQPSDVVVRFNRATTQDVNAGNLITLHGKYTGNRSILTRAQTSGGNTRTVTINPGNDFYPGEEVQVTVHAAMTDTLDYPMEKPYQFEFRAKTASVTSVSYGTPGSVAFANVPASIALADIDLDGDLDIVMGNNTNVQFRRNSGSGTFGPVTNITFTGTIAFGSKVQVYDFDNDGDVDIYYSGLMFGNNGSGSFTQVSSTTSNLNDPLVTDINADGWLDLVYTNFGGMYIWLNQRNMDFGTPLTTSFSSLSFIKPQAVDFNGDGLMDLVTARFDTVYFLKNEGSLKFSIENKEKIFGVSTIRYLITGDFDNNGTADVGIASHTLDVVQFMQTPYSVNSATVATIHFKNNTSTQAWDLRSLDVADINGDGKLDILAANGNSTSISYVLNNSTSSQFGWLTSQSVSCGTSTVGDIMAGDLDGDGDMDFATANPGDNTSSVGLMGGSPNVPVISGMSPTTGVAGTTVTLTGKNLSCVNQISFNGVNASSYSVLSSTMVTVVVPSSATSGQVVLTCTIGSGSAPGNFYVCPGGPQTPVATIVQNPGGLVCAGLKAGFEASLTNMGAASSVTWAVNGTPVAFTNSLSAAGLTNGAVLSLTATTSDGCATSSIATTQNTITVNPFPAAPLSIVGDAFACGGSVTYSVAPVSGASSYNWTYPPDWSASSSSNSITVTPAGGGYLSVKAVNSCGEGPATSFYVDPGTGNVSVSASASGSTICNAGTTLTLTASSSGTAASGSFGWAKHIKSTLREWITDVQTAPNGDVLVTGLFYDQVSVDSAQLMATSSSSTSSFLMRFDNAGVLKWKKKMEALVHCNATAVAPDQFGNTYVSGYFNGKLTIDSHTAAPMYSSNNLGDLFYAKFDADGNCVWLKRGGGAYGDIANDLKLDAAGNPYIMGVISNHGVFYLPSIASTTYVLTGSSNSHAVFVAKIHPTTGDLVWLTKADPQGSSGGQYYEGKLSVDAAGNSILWGSGSGSYSLGLAGTVSITDDQLMLKVSNTGGFVYAETATLPTSSNPWHAVTNDGTYAYLLTYQGPSSTVYYGSTQVTTPANSGLVLIKKNLSTMATVWIKPLVYGIVGGTGYTDWFDLVHSGDHLYLGLSTYNDYAINHGAVQTTSSTVYNADVMVIKSDTSGLPVAFARNKSVSNEWATNIAVGAGGIFLGAQGIPNGFFGGHRFYGEGDEDTYVMKVNLQSPGNTNLQYSWMPAGLTGTSAVVSPTATTIYTVTASAGGCGASATVAIAVTTPSITSSASDYSLCPNEVSTLTAAGGDSYTWSPAASLSSATGSMVTASPSVTTIYTVTGADLSGCTGISTVQVFVGQSPTITTTPVTPTLCAGKSATVVASGAISYTWSPGSSLNTTNGATVIASPAAGTTYTVAGSNTLGCVGTKLVGVNVTALPTVSLSTLQPSLCSGAISVMMASGATSYTWQPGNHTGNGFAVQPFTTTSYSVTASVANCTNTVPVVMTISVSPTPTVTISASPPFGVCAGSSATLTASGASTYSWTGIGTGSAITVNPLSTTNYTVTGTTTAGCVGTRTQNVSASPVPTLGFSGTNTLCAGGSVVNVVNGASTYTWTDGTATIVTSAPTLSPNVTTVYTVTGRNSSGCESTAARTITVHQPPAVSISGGSVAVCAASPVTLTASGANTYSWSTSSTNTTIVITPLASVNYSVTGTSSAGCKSTVFTNFTVNPAPTLSITGTATLCSGATGTLNVSGANTYTWNDFSNAQSLTVSPAANTTFSVSGTDLNGCIGNAARVITVSPNPTVVASSTAICLGASHTIVASGAASYGFSGGSNVVTPTSSTNYSITGTSSVGCVSASAAVITVSTIALPTVTASDGSVCAGKPFVINPAGATSYTYSGGSATVTPVSTSTYAVGGFSAGCAAASPAIITVTVVPLPVVSAPGATVCAGGSVVITPGGAVNYTYSSGSATVSPVITTTYYVTGASAAGCVSSPSTAVVVTVMPLPSVSVTGTKTLCAGNSVTLNAGGNAAAHTWLPGGSNASSLVVAPTANSDYTLQGSSSAGCTNSAVVTVTVHSLPGVSVNSGTLCSGQSFTLMPGGGATYSFQGGSAIVSPATSTSYTVRSISAEGCISATAAVADLTVMATPTISASGGSICAGSQFTIATSGAPVYSITGGSFTVSPAFTTTYATTGTSTAGCVSSSVLVTVSVVPVPTLNISGTTSLCAGGTVTLTGSGASTYSWSNNANTHTVAVSPASTSVYTLSGYTGGVCHGSAAVTVTVHALPAVSISGNGSHCIGSALVLNASGALQYLWSNAGTGPSISVSPATNTVYSVVGTSSAGCTASAALNVTAFPTPTVTAMQPLITVCEGHTFVPAGTGASTYAWSGGLTDNVANTAVASGIYTVTGTSSSGCTGTGTLNLSVQPSPTLIASTSQQTTCPGDTVQLSVQGAISYTWDNGAEDSVITVSPNATTVFTVTGIGSNGCTRVSTLTQVVDVCTGIKESELYNYGVFPNPNDGTFEVHVPGSARGFTGEITNALGQVIMTVTLSETTVVNLPRDYANGLYFLRIKKDNRVMEEVKIVKQQ